MKNESYHDLLHNALWQKKRLEIMQRDNFSCVKCGRGINDGTPLHVHHKIYYPNRNPWEYEDDCLETLCENCHKKEHSISLNKEKDFSCAGKRPKSAKGHMKITFYRSLLKLNPFLTPNEKILYSFLVAKSIQRLDDVFNPDGMELNLNNLGFYINDENKWIDLAEINHCKLARELEMTRPTVINGLKQLRKKRFIIVDKYGNEYIYAPPKLIEHGFFELHHADILCGELLVFYSYLLDKSAKYGYHIDTFKYKLAQDLNKSKIAITKLLNRLYNLNLAKRLPNGKLLIK